MARLLTAVSAHGFGHVAQTAPVVNALRRRRPELELTIRCAAPPAFLRSRFEGAFTLDPSADDFGMCQFDALRVDAAASAERYAAQHADWERRVDAVARQLEAAAPDLILADVPYLTLAAAARAGIPAVAMSCLNWADIYRHYCAGRPEAADIHRQMQDAYRGARAFLRTAPAMPMAWLDNAVDIGPVVQPAASRRAHIAANAGLAPNERLAVMALGGIGTRPPLERWPALPGVRFAVQADWGVRRPDTIAFEELGVSFAELLASADLFLTKPGYGSFAEAAALALPVLYVERPGWPESPYLERWLQQRVPCIGVPRERFDRGDVAEAIERLLAAERPAPTAPSGVAEAVDYLDRLLP